LNSFKSRPREAFSFRLPTLLKQFRGLLESRSRYASSKIYVDISGSAWIYGSSRGTIWLFFHLGNAFALVGINNLQGFIPKCWFLDKYQRLTARLMHPLRSAEYKPFRIQHQFKSLLFRYTFTGVRRSSTRCSYYQENDLIATVLIVGFHVIRPRIGTHFFFIRTLVRIFWFVSTLFFRTNRTLPLRYWTIPLRTARLSPLRRWTS